MQKTLLSHPKLHATITTGREGPHFDPYGYTEFCITTDKDKILLHEGLGIFAIVNGEKIEARNEDYENSYWLDSILKEHTGYTTHQILRFSRKMKSKCPEGGTHETISVSGYPGETLYKCVKCNKIVDGSFDISAVM